MKKYKHPHPMYMYWKSISLVYINDAIFKNNIETVLIR